MPAGRRFTAYEALDILKREQGAVSVYIEMLFIEL